MKLDDFILAQQTDEFCTEIIQQLHHNTRFSIENQILIHQDKYTGKTIVLPESLIDIVLHNHHYTVYANHKSREKMYQEISSTWYYPNLRNAIETYTKKCFFCIYGRNFRDIPQAHGKTPTSNKPFDLWYFDIASGLGTETDTEYKYVYVFVDFYSLHCVLIPARTKSSEEIQEAFKQHIIAHYGMPTALRGDRESAVATSEDFKQFAIQHGIQLLLTAGHSPQSNSVAETKINLLKTSMRTLLLATGERKWSDQLFLIANQINSSKTNYGYSPNEILFGISNSNDPRNLLETEFIPAQPDQYIKEISTKLSQIRMAMQSRREAHTDRVRDYKNKGKSYKQFTEGQLVWISNNVIKGKSGLTMKRIGPAIIESLNKNSSTAQVRNLATGMRTKVHYSHLTKVDSDTNKLPETWDNQIKNVINQ